MFGMHSWSITERYANNVKTECLKVSGSLSGQHQPKIVEFGDEINEIYVSHSSISGLLIGMVVHINACMHVCYTHWTV